MSDRLLKDELLTVKIEKLTFGGNGLARHNNFVIFIPLAAKDDLLKIKIIEVKKNFCSGEIVEILQPSSDRTTPLCSVYGECGGCDWQHLKYSAQTKTKQNLTLEFLHKFINSHTQILPIVASEHQFNYRNRVQMKSNGKSVGFYKKNTHKLVPIDSCPLMEEALNTKLRTLKNSVDLPEKFELSLQEQFGFSQVNRFQNEKIQKTILSWIGNENYPHIFDLYAGSGNFCFYLLQANIKSQFIAVESSSEAVKHAHSFIKTNNFSPKKIQFFNSEVEHFLKRTPLFESSLVLLDPPRVGCAEFVLNALGKQKPKKIFYLSCNPSTLSRDLTLLLKYSDNAYQLKKIQVFDMFPQTHHIEVLIELTVDT